ncbi:MAG: murein biosynthesis integral membrane protein MurJ, partial [Myxococcaceae bacterium]
MAGPAAKDRGGRGALFVAAGILLSRVMGLVRERVFAHYLGNSIAAAAFKAALRIPNFLQNLFGEGVLSASFIPIYARLLAEDKEEEADHVAGAIFGILSLVVSVLVAGGVFAAPSLIDLIVPGFKGEARTLTITIVRILFPATGLLVLSAWCLGILNSHRRFFLSYAAPALWNLALIATLLLFGWRSSQEQLVIYLGWGTVLGSFLQFAVQVPTVLKLLGKFRYSVSLRSVGVRAVLAGFGPVVVGRGVVQVSAWVDQAYASLVSADPDITARCVSTLAYAQTLYLIPVSLFGMAISAAELPEMSQALGTTEEVALKLRTRIDNALKRIAFFVIPSAAAFLFLGDLVGGALLQTGHFTAADTRYLWYLLMGSTVGLLAATQGRLYASSFYALKDTRTPLYYAIIRVILTAGLAYWSAVKMPSQLGIPDEFGGVGITATTGIAAWIEFLMLRRAL